MRKHLTLLIIIILLLIGFTYLQTRGGRDLPVMKNFIYKNDCKELILTELSAPSTAVWGELNVIKLHDYISLIDQEYSGFHLAIKGTVDSQNGLGGVGRTDFICFVNNDGWIKKTITKDNNPLLYNEISNN